MIFVGIDVSKYKHDIHIKTEDGSIIVDKMTIANNISGFSELLQKIDSVSVCPEDTKIGLEATGHYSNNLANFLCSNGKCVYLLNPMLVNNFRKGRTLRLTKTDSVDAKTITDMLMSCTELKPYSPLVYHNSEIKSLTRFLFRRKKELQVQKIHVSRLLTLLFPELEPIVSNIHSTTVYAVLMEFPGMAYLRNANLRHLTSVVEKASYHALGKDFAETIRKAALNSIGTSSEALSLELQSTVRTIRSLADEIDLIKKKLDEFCRNNKISLSTVPGMSNTQAACIVSEIGDISRFPSADCLLAYAGLSPSTKQSGTMDNHNACMEKRGSRYLRHYILNTALTVRLHNPVFKQYYEKKVSEGKHYNVVMTHVAKKLVRLLFAMLNSANSYHL